MNSYSWNYDLDLPTFTHYMILSMYFYEFTKIIACKVVIGHRARFKFTRQASFASHFRSVYFLGAVCSNFIECCSLVRVEWTDTNTDS